jgi:hypothetical protein
MSPALLPVHALVRLAPLRLLWLPRLACSLDTASFSSSSSELADDDKGSSRQVSTATTAAATYDGCCHDQCGRHHHCGRYYDGCCHYDGCCEQQLLSLRRMRPLRRLSSSSFSPSQPRCGHMALRVFVFALCVPTLWSASAL